MIALGRYTDHKGVRCSKAIPSISSTPNTIHHMMTGGTVAPNSHNCHFSHLMVHLKTCMFNCIHLMYTPTNRDWRFSL